MSTRDFFSLTIAAGLGLTWLAVIFILIATLSSYPLMTSIIYLVASW